MNMGIARASVMALVATWASTVVAAPECGLPVLETFQHKEIGPISIYGKGGGSDPLLFTSHMQVNTDGAPDAYHPDDTGITHICNGISVYNDKTKECDWKAICLADFNRAKSQGFTGSPKICFFAIATDGDGRPMLQGDHDPKPGYFVSTTALKQPGAGAKTQSAQLDSNVIPYAVIPGKWTSKAQNGSKPQVGDFGVAYRKSNGKLAYFIIGDTGPGNKIGEGSVALHQALGHSPFTEPKGKKRRANAGIGGRDVTYLLFAGSRLAKDDEDFGKPYTAQMIEAYGSKLLDGFGGQDRLTECAGALAAKPAAAAGAQSPSAIVAPHAAASPVAVAGAGALIPASPPGAEISSGPIDREIFYANMKEILARKEVFTFVNKKGKTKKVEFAATAVSGARKVTIDQIFDYWEKTGSGHAKHLALMLGTAYRESCGTLSTGIGEACGCSPLICDKDELPTADYGHKNAKGLAYFGRGLVQITHERNYDKIGRLMGIPLVDQPSLAYEPEHAIKMLVDGVRHRWFAGKPMTQYLDDDKSEWVLARNSVNPGSPNRAATGYLACRFYEALQPAVQAHNPAQTVSSCMELKNV